MYLCKYTNHFAIQPQKHLLRVWLVMTRNHSWKNCILVLFTLSLSHTLVPSHSLDRCSVTAGTKQLINSQLSVNKWACILVWMRGCQHLSRPYLNSWALRHEGPCVSQRQDERSTKWTKATGEMLPLLTVCPITRSIFNTVLLFDFLCLKALPFWGTPLLVFLARAGWENWYYVYFLFATLQLFLHSLDMFDPVFMLYWQICQLTKRNDRDAES